MKHFLPYWYSSMELIDFRAFTSLYSIPFKNWIIATLKPAPAARMARPIAAVVFPLPFPV